MNDFSSLDKALGEEFLTFSSLHFGGVEAAYHPTSVAIREISLTDFYSRIIVQPDGKINLQGIIAKEDAGRDNTASKPEARPSPRPRLPRTTRRGRPRFRSGSTR